MTGVIVCNKLTQTFFPSKYFKTCLNFDLSRRVKGFTASNYFFNNTVILKCYGITVLIVRK